MLSIGTRHQTLFLLSGLMFSASLALNVAGCASGDSSSDSSATGATAGSTQGGSGGSNSGGDSGSGGSGTSGSSGKSGSAGTAGHAEPLVTQGQQARRGCRARRVRQRARGQQARRQQVVLQVRATEVLVIRVRQIPTALRITAPTLVTQSRRRKSV